MKRPYKIHEAILKAKIFMLNDKQAFDDLYNYIEQLEKYKEETEKKLRRKEDDGK